MKILSINEAFCKLCKTTGKYGMYICFETFGEGEVKKAAPYLKEDCDQIIADCEGILLFENKEEMWNYYNQTVGSYGPTKLNDYNGPASVYAMTCNPHGQIETENC